MAVYMIGFLLFPMVYQPIHQGHHHDQVQILHSCEKHNDQQQPDHAAESAHIYHSPEPCPICDYEFLIQDLPSSAELALATMPSCEQITLTFSGEVYKSAYSQKSPRAPPIA